MKNLNDVWITMATKMKLLIFSVFLLIHFLIRFPMEFSHEPKRASRATDGFLKNFLSVFAIIAHPPLA